MTRRLLLTAFLLLLIPTLSFAQDAAPTIEFYGVIQGAADGQIDINGMAIDIRGAQINAPLQLGTTVHVRAILGAGGQIVAQQIDRVPPEVVPGIVEIEGIVTAFTPTTVTVGDQTFDTSTAQINGGITLGQPIHLFAISPAPGTWIAVSVSGIPTVIATPEIIPPPAETPEIIVVPPPAETPEAIVIPPPAETPEIIVLPPVGTPEVLPPVGTPEVFPPVEAGEDIKFEGNLDAFTDAYVIVDGQRFFIGGARIDGELRVGVPVLLEIRNVNGQWVMEEIKVVGSSDDGSGGNSGSGSGGSGSGSGGSGSGDNGGNSGKGSSGSGSSGSGSGSGNSGGDSSGSGSGGSGSGGSGSGSDNSGHGSGGSDDSGGHGSG